MAATPSSPPQPDVDSPARSSKSKKEPIFLGSTGNSPLWYPLLDGGLTPNRFLGLGWVRKTQIAAGYWRITGKRHWTITWNFEHCKAL